MITKNDLCLAAFNEARISGLTVTPNNAQLKSAIQKLDSMVLAWQNKGLCLSYIRSEGFADVDPNQDSGINDTSAQAVILNLTKMICPMFGKPVHPQTSLEARTSYLGLFSKDLSMREASPYQPLGSGSGHGYSYYYRPKFQEQNDNAPTNCDTQNLKIGETDSFSVDFNSYLSEIDGETIISYVIDSGTGITIGDNNETDGVISFYATGELVGAIKVKITITTATRTNPETIYFNITES